VIKIVTFRGIDMPVTLNDKSTTVGGIENDTSPRAVIRIAFPSFRIGRGKDESRGKKFHPTTREELQDLFDDDLRRSKAPVSR
jgi:hypothetical protein